jgi:hypothetical protein
MGKIRPVTRTHGIGLLAVGSPSATIKRPSFLQLILVDCFFPWVLALLFACTVGGWQTSDWAVAASLWQRGSAYSGRATVAVLLCLLPYAVLALVLFRPFYRLQARGLARVGRPALTLAAAAGCWLLAGPFVVVGADLALLTYFLCADPQRSAQLIYYERLRMLTEVGTPCPVACK